MDRALFGSRLAAFRRQKKLTQKELAEALHVTDKAVSKWERGVNYPDITLMQPLADCLGIPVAQLLTEIDDPSDQPAAIVQSCAAVSQEITARERWISFFKGTIAPILLIAINLYLILHSGQSTIRRQIEQSKLYYESPAVIAQNLGQGIDAFFSFSSLSESAEGETLALEFKQNYLCGATRPFDCLLTDGDILLHTTIKSGEARLILLNAAGKICYFEKLKEGEHTILLPNGSYQLSVCGYWFSGKVLIDVNEREPVSNAS